MVNICDIKNIWTMPIFDRPHENSLSPHQEVIIIAMSANFPYYYGSEADQYAFFRIPKLLVFDERFRGISTDAKLLYGLMLDRMGLSLKNGWLDRENRVYIYFPVEEVMEMLNCKSEKATKLLAELDSKRGIGLIERVRQGQGRPSIIYVKNFAANPPG